MGIGGIGHRGLNGGPGDVAHGHLLPVAGPADHFRRGQALAVLIPRPFDLVGGSGAAPQEVLGKVMGIIGFIH